MNSELTKQNETLLLDNPLFYSSTTVSNIIASAKINLLTISIPGHSFITGNRITLTGVTTNQSSIKAIYKYTDQDEEKKGYSVIFEENKKSLIIKCDYTTSVLYDNGYVQEDSPENVVNMSFDPNFKVGDGISYDILKAYDTSDMYVTLSGFIGTTIGNIPVNFLNSTHRIYFVNPDSSGDVYINVPDGTGTVTSITGFYILLPDSYHSGTNLSTPPLENTDMTIDIEFKYIGGIPINALSADIPITNDNIYGYFSVYSTTLNTISVKLTKDTYYINPTPSNKPQIGQVPINFGGNVVYISDIAEIVSGYNEPNNYVINLSSTIKNIFMIKLVNTVFPNTSRTFKKTVNNKIYWQNLDDGQNIYSTQVAEGNYTPTDLAATLQKQMFAVTRVDVPEIPVNGGYTNKVLFLVSIDQNTNITSFSSFKEAVLRQPIISILDTEGKPPPTDITKPGNPPYILQIKQPMHGLVIGDQVLFLGFITTLGVPDVVLNTTHIVANIIDADNYEILIDNFNLSFSRLDEKGGFAAKVYVKNKFRLLFDQPDTMGVELGFRNVGNLIAITKYNTVITNQDAYQNEIIIYEPPTGLYYISDGSGQQIILKNNSLKFSGDDYILMIIREFSGCGNISGNKQLTDYFAKINLSGLPGKILYDTYVSAPVLFYDMITLGQLTLTFYGSNGKLYDFNGVDHSFVLEITSLDLLPQETGLNSTNNFI